MVSLILISVLGVAEGRQIIDDPAHSFRFELPAGFVSVADAHAALGDKKQMLGVWANKPDPEHTVLVSLEAMSAPLKRGDDEGMGWVGQPIPVTWNNFVLQAVRRENTSTNGISVMYAVQFPAKPVAVLLIVAGPRSNDAMIRAEFEDAVLSFDAPSNWVTELERHQTPAPGTETPFAAALLVASIVGGMALRFFVLRRRK